MEVVMALVSSVVAMASVVALIASKIAERRAQEGLAKPREEPGRKVTGELSSPRRVLDTTRAERPAAPVSPLGGPAEGSRADMEASYHVARLVVSRHLNTLPPGYDQGTFHVLRETLSKLAGEVTDLVTPASRYLQYTAALLQEFEQSEAFRTFFASRRLQRKYLNGYISSHIANIRDWTDVKEYQEETAPFKNLFLAVEDLQRFAASWERFRGEVAKGLFWKKEGQPPDPDQYDELRHSLSPDIRHQPTGRDMIWVSWQGMLSSPSTLEQLASWLQTVFEQMKWGPETTICTMSTSILLWGRSWLARRARSAN